jgi:alkylation response protein AidB-like acyl-CoA dehydrogenase
MPVTELAEVDRAVVERARALAPRIRAAAAQIDAERRLPPELADALADGELLRLFAPRSCGGVEAHPLTAMRAIEELSRADGSAGWVAMIGTDLSLLLGWLSEDTLREMSAPGRGIRMAGSLPSDGTAIPVDGGYRVSGRWDFVSGIDHSDWVFCGCRVVDRDLTPTEPLIVRGAVAPKSAGEVIDTWSVLGMHGTRSADFVLRDVFVPTNRMTWLSDAPVATSPLYVPGAREPDDRYRFGLTWMWVAHAGNALGIGRGMIDIVQELASRKASTASPVLLRDRPAVQTRVAEAEAIVSAARAYLVEGTRDAWAAAEDCAEDPSAAIIHARLAIAHAINESRRAVDLLFHAVGTNAIFTENRLERCFRDIHTSAHHGAGSSAQFTAAGKFLLGGRD